LGAKTKKNMKNEKKMMFISEDMDNALKRRIDVLVRTYFAKHRKKFIADYIEVNFLKFMGVDRPLTSKEVMGMLQISRATLNRRINMGKIKPANPNERVHRFLKSEIIEHLNSRKGSCHGR